MKVCGGNYNEIIHSFIVNDMTKGQVDDAAVFQFEKTCKLK